MNRINKKFIELKKNKKKAFIPFLMSGDPSLELTKSLMSELEKQGASIIELGVPFSDPLADGPTIQKSAERALKNNVNIDSACRLVSYFRKKSDIPIVFLIYYNLIHNYGIKRFVRKLIFSGVDGIVVPDLPPEESCDLRAAACNKGLAVIHLMAPTSSLKRMKKIASASEGFIYYVSLTGTTGAKRKLPIDIKEGLKRARSITKKPICVGFGISNAEQVKKISKIADGVIVGSAIIKEIEKNIGKKELVKNIGSFTGNLIR